MRAIRKRIGMTQAAFAEELGVSVTTVKAWEKQERYPQIDKYAIAFAIADGKLKPTINKERDLAEEYAFCATLGGAFSINTLGDLR